MTLLQGGAIDNRGRLLFALVSVGLPKQLRILAVVIPLFFMICSCGRSPQAAQTAALPPLQLVSHWGQAGTQPGQFQNPQAIACDAVGNVLIADDGKPTQVEKFDQQGHPLLDFAASGTQNDSDIAVDPGGAIFLLDRQHGQLQIFSPEGEAFRTLFFRYRRDFHNPSSLAIGLDGNFFLADPVSGRIMRVSPRGRALEGWGKPSGLDIARWAPFPIRLAPDGNLYAADPANGRIVRLTSVGQYVASWQFPFAALDSSNSAPRADGLAVSAAFVAASDAGKRLLQIWTLDGQPKLTVDFSQHQEWGEHAAPTDIAFTPKGDLLVLDRPDSQVLLFKLNIGR